MIIAITWQLLMLLLIASLLGIVIGVSGTRLYLTRAQKEAYNPDNGNVGGLSTEHNDPDSENVGIMQALDSEKKLVKMSRIKQAQLAAQQETLQVHTGLQAQRLVKLTSELHASEEKCIRLQRDFASYKANKLREVRMLKVSPDEWLDNEELPVLNKKVDQLTPKGINSELQESDDYTPDLDQTQPIITSELDIPSLAESELPNSVEELEFELINDENDQKLEFELANDDELN